MITVLYTHLQKHKYVYAVQFIDFQAQLIFMVSFISDSYRLSYDYDSSLSFLY